MIRIDDKYVEVNGTKMELHFELTQLIHALYEKKIVTKQDLVNLCNLAVMDEEDVRKEAKKIIEDISDAIRKSREDFASEELFNKMFGDLDN